VVDDPASSGFRTQDDESSFDAEGRALWEALEEELGSAYKVSYFSVTEGHVGLHRPVGTHDDR
jgi:hypothetical protein